MDVFNESWFEEMGVDKAIYRAMNWNQNSKYNKSRIYADDHNFPVFSMLGDIREQGEWARFHFAGRDGEHPESGHLI